MFLLLIKLTFHLFSFLWKLHARILKGPLKVNVSSLVPSNAVRLSLIWSGLKIKQEKQPTWLVSKRARKGNSQGIST